MNRIIIIIISLFCLIFFYEGRSGHFSERVYLSSEAIMIFSVFMIFSSDGRAYSLRKIFYLFTLFFFGVAPLIQFYHRTSSFNARLLKEHEYFHMNLLVFTIMLAYEIFYRGFSAKSKSYNPSFIRKLKISNLRLSQEVILILVSLFSLLYVVYINDFVIMRLFFRGGEFAADASDKESSSLGLLMSQTIRPLAFISFLYYLLVPRRHLLVTVILFCLSFITIFPAAVPRFYAAAVYIPLMLISFKPFAKKNIFSLTFIGGLLIVFPFLNNFRHFSRNTELKLDLNFDMFVEGHFDSYQNFALIYFSDIITWGQQLLGVMFFWVPRTIWPTKPIGSGYLLAHKMQFSWDNISANYFAEGYINFGYAGIFLFVVVLAFTTSLLDNLYWNRLQFIKNNFFKAAYLLLLGMLFFVMRGDLLSSTAFTVGFMFSFLIIYFLVHRKPHEINH